MLKNSFVISGPEDDSNIPRESLGKYLFNCLKQRKYDAPLNIDGVTGETITTGQMLENSVKMVQVLEGLQIKKGDVIALMCENSVNYCIPLLASFYMGVTVTNLNPGYSKGELKHCLNLSKPKLIICCEMSIVNVLKVKAEFDSLETVLLLESSSENHLDVRSVKDLLETVSAVDVQNYEPEDFDPSEQDALIMMSSGTTGLPKGVLLTHQNLRMSLLYMGHPKYIGLSSETTTVVVVPFFHIFGLLLQVAGIYCGMKSIVINRFKPNTFLEAVQKYKCTKLFVVPPLLLFLAKSPLVDNYDLSSVTDILCGAAPVSKDVGILAKKRFMLEEIRELYGLTEVCGALTIIPPNFNKVGSAGVLVPGTSAKVWDLETKEVVGPLKSGELCFKGDMIMKAYIRNPTETKDSIDEDGFYHTGDIGYYDKDGYFYIIDRVKELIKYKGFQVSPAELENLLITHPGVKDCGVIGITDERAGQVPLAYVVRQNNVKVTEEEIVDFVAERISTQKHLYGGVKFIEEIPRNPSGKILRRSLMEMFKTSQ